MYFVLFKSQLDYVSAAWNSIMVTGSNRFEGIQKKSALCHSKFVKYSRSLL
jgi:hypothetical protein